MSPSLSDVASCRLHSWQQSLRSAGKRPHPSCRGPEGVELLAQRLQQLRLDPAYVEVCHASVYKDLERVCAACRFQRICALDLASGDVQSGMRVYCPNAPVIDAVTVNWIT